MFEYLDDFIHRLKKFSDASDLSNYFSNSLKKHGFSNYVLGSFSAIGSFSLECLDINEYPDDWINHYFEKGYEAIDPVIQTGRISKLPFKWSETPNILPKYSDKQKNFMKEAKEAGLAEGIAVPCVGDGGKKSFVSVVAPSVDDKELNEAMHVIHVMAMYFHASYNEILKQESSKTQDIPQLTVRERECLVWIAKGKSSWDIGNIMNISQKTVDFHVENAKKKLDTFTRPQAVVKAIKYNLISI